MADPEKRKGILDMKFKRGTRTLVAAIAYGTSVLSHHVSAGEWLIAVILILILSLLEEKL